VVASDFCAAETSLARAGQEPQTPDQAFERQWALALLEEVYRRLEREHKEQGKSALFAALRATLAGRGQAQPYADLARQLGMTEGAVRVAVHRLRQRYRDLLRAAIADTVAGAGEVEDELRYLLQVLGGC
jgi:RNA polymerase sigma-70 factor (ECF subfamily)